MDYRRKNLGVVGTIITINVVLFIPWILLFIFQDKTLLDYLLNYGALNINLAKLYEAMGVQQLPTINTGAIWQLLTSIFIHGGIWHLVFNMYALYIFGKPLEERWGKGKFLSFYLIVGILANVASALFFMMGDQPVRLIGASGAIFGVLLAFGGYYPNVRLLLFFFIPIKVKWAILLFAIIELYAEISGTGSGIAHVTHLFGFLFGFLYLLIFFKMNPIKEMFFPRKNYFHYE